MYVKVSTRLTSDMIEVKEYAAGGYGAPGKRRRKKKNISPEIKEKHNALARERRLQNLILLNFSEGWNITLRYRKDNQPKDYEEAKHRCMLFRKSLREELKKYGITFKYIVVTEKGSKAGHFHHHLIVEGLWDEGIDIRDFVAAKWEKYGTTYNSKLHDEGNYKQLAEYLAKSKTKEDRKKTDEGKNIPIYQVSRNLKWPEVISKETYYGDMHEPEAPKGWFVDTESLISGINPYTGKKYQRYYIKSTLEKVIERVLEKNEKKEEENTGTLADINLYMVTKVENGEADSIYMLECMKKDGSPFIKGYHAQIKGTKDRIVLYSIISAIGHVKVPSRIKIFIQNPVVKGAIQNNWMEKWEKQDWKNGKGEPVTNAEEWKKLREVSKIHRLVIAPKSENATHGWSLQQLNRLADEYYKRKG